MSTLELSPLPPEDHVIQHPTDTQKFWSQDEGWSEDWGEITLFSRDWAYLMNASIGNLGGTVLALAATPGRVTLETTT